MIPRARPLPNGLVVMFEGIDGAGKTTQVQRAQAALEQAGWPVLCTRNLGGTPVGEALREVLLSGVSRPALTDFYVSLAIQAPLLELVDQARKDGKVVLMDRGPLSLGAYQIYGAGIDPELGWRHVADGMDHIKPDGIIFYDSDVQTAMDRKRNQTAKPDYFESKSPEYFQNVRNGYHEAIQRYPATVIDAAGSVETVEAQTLAALAKLLADKDGRTS